MTYLKRSADKIPHRIDCGKFPFLILVIVAQPKRTEATKVETLIGRRFSFNVLKREKSVKRARLVSNCPADA